MMSIKQFLKDVISFIIVISLLFISEFLNNLSYISFHIDHDDQNTYKIILDFKTQTLDKKKV